MTKARNPRRTVIQGVKAARHTLSEVFKTWNQAQRIHDENYMGGVTRGLAEGERRENQPEAWKSLRIHAGELREVADMFEAFAEAHERRLAGEDVDMSAFDGTDEDDESGESGEDVPLPA